MSSSASLSSAPAPTPRASRQALGPWPASPAAFDALNPADRGFLLACGSLRTIADGEAIAARRGEEAALGFVLEGQLERAADPAQSGRTSLGAGMVLGLQDFLQVDGRIAGHDQAIARGGAAVLLVTHRELRGRCASAPAFAARLFEVLARTLATPAEARAAGDPELQELERELEELQHILHDAEVAALAHQGAVPEAEAQTVQAVFRRFVVQLHRSLGPDSRRSEAECEAIGRRVQRVVLPYLLLTETSERLYAKPRGYAGDSVSIEGIYANQAAGRGRLGPLLDACFLAEPAAQAVRNRRGLLAEEIRAVLARTPERPVQITTMACGPAREVFDVFAQLDDPSRLHVHLIDFDHEALEEVPRRAAERGLSAQLSLHHANLIDLSLGRQQLDLPPQDLVYSIGLIDYFVDKLVVRLMSYGHRLLRPGAEMILGNFHPANENKALMDHVLDWRLIHRTEDDLDRMYLESAFGRPAIRFRFEQAGVNLFAFCRKAGEPASRGSEC